ncbi:glucan biosynthesis protein [Qingshengfaniella alkalisoli]|uniref:Glucan biosynthesis protein G n=1 Tax=Qingshengfaniella alkalisoli TaxID=2599296 RepID=A0A5B8J198_9RHOB|nr:glucan biosynthesis protein [Qingshengfaniella alkalisoli]QDY71553.1 glucan biosynthesis protein G [Qingshengfaniella alkalisoli]
MIEKTRTTLSRRSLLAGSAALAASTAIPTWVIAQSNAPVSANQPFDFDTLTEAVKQRAQSPDPGPAKIEPVLKDLNYDGWRKIQYDPERARWNEDGSRFHMHAFHPGWLFPDPVELFEVRDGVAAPMSFTTSDFIYHGDLEGRVDPEVPMAGVAGWRLAYPLNRADTFDELIAFLGASYFRALGRDNAYGASARGLALNTATGQAEEFPRFSSFYLEPPAPGSTSLTAYAVLDSQSVTGAYRFVISPGENTEIDVTARLFFRSDVEQLGVAPLTSMFLYDETNRSRFDDFRPQVHDSNGLQIRRRGGTVQWRALANPPRLSSSYFSEDALSSFGLHQRDRDFASYEDAESRYERRPSIDVEPIGDWGNGVVRLVEIPSDLEINDNIVAFWVPEDDIRAGDEREFRYRLIWGMLNPDQRADLAYVHTTHSGEGGVSGVENNDSSSRKFVVDFSGGTLDHLSEDNAKSLEPEFNVSNAKIESWSLHKIDGEHIWRLAFDVVPEGNRPIELSAYVTGYDQRLSETWSYQWVRS